MLEYALESSDETSASDGLSMLPAVFSRHASLVAGLLRFDAGEGAEIAAGRGHIEDGRFDMERIEDDLVADAGIAGHFGDDVVGVLPSKV